jgi:dipeptidyl aminopeptidase/acylaminoacyl peptidase
MFSSFRSAAIGVVALTALAVGAQAQTTSTAPAQEPAARGKLFTPADIKAWNTIRQTALSPDGKWFAYVLAPNEGNATVVVRSTAQAANETIIPVGENGGSITISGDSKWLGFLVAPPRAPNNQNRGAGRAGNAGRGAAGQGGAAQDSANRRNKFVLMNLASGEKKEFDRIRRFTFNGDNTTWVALQGYPPQTPNANAAGGAAGRAGGGGGRDGGAGAPASGAESGGGADVMLYNIATGETLNLGKVNEYAFSDAGDWLAYTMDTPDQVGNSVQLFNLKTNAVRPLESERVLYRQLAWVDSSSALSVMRGKIDETARDTVFSIEAFTAFLPTGPSKKLLFEPAGREDFPKGWKLASDRAPRYAGDLSAVFFGIREASKPNAGGNRGTSAVQPGAPGMGGTINQARGGGAGNNADEDPSLVLWHAKDPRLQSQQIVQEAADRAYNYLSEFRFTDNKFIRLADDELRNVTVTRGEKFAYGVDTRAYEQVGSYSGRNYQDIYTIDLKTGARKRVMEKKPSVGGMSASPDGRKLLYWGSDGHYWVLDLLTGETTNISKSVATTFVNTEDDHNNLFPPAIAARGWSSDGSAVVLYDNWDLWKVPVKQGVAAVNLTGDGKKNQVRYQRLYDFSSRGPAAPAGGGGRFGGAGDAAGIDLSKPLYVATYGEWTKKEGLSRVDPGKAGATPVFFEDARFNITKARDAETYVYTRQTFTEFPNYWVFNPGFKFGYQITDANPQMKEFAWSSGTRLVDYVSEKGDKLQGALYLPANYDPSKKYPLLVTIYEKRSQNKNGFVSPSETRAPDPAQFTNRGYAVFDPDIVYRVNDPGMSAVWCVIPAVKAAIETGVVDPTKVGLWGHSWGGYQTAFLVTQTSIFKSAIAGAPLTDMVSMYSSVYWNTGGANQAIFESSQGRFKGNFIDNYDAYIRNSPAFFANKVTTPLIILHNDKDGAVDFNQGVTYFNTLRQLGKDVIMLEYVGENHGLARPANQKDYAGRMAEWFDYHLRGLPAPEWIKNGVPRLKMADHLAARKDTTTVKVVF